MLQRRIRFAALRYSKQMNNYFVLKQPWINDLIKPLKFFLAERIVSSGIKDKLAKNFLEAYNRTRKIDFETSESVVVIATFIHEYYHYLLTEGSIGMLLKSRGINSKIYYNDRRDFYDLFFEDRDLFHINYMWNLTRKIDAFLQTNLPNLYVPFSASYIPDDMELKDIAAGMIKNNQFKLKGLDLLPHIEIGMSRYYRSCPKMDVFESDYNDVFLKMTCNACKSTLLAESIYHSAKPTAVIMSHAIYTFWGPMYDYFTKQGVKTYIIRSSPAWRKNSIYYHVNNVPHQEMLNILDNNAENRDIYECVKESVNSIMKKRFALDTADIKDVAMIESDPQSEQSIIKVIGSIKKEGYKIFGMFPNLLYDYSFTTRRGAFSTITDWITDTVQYFERSGDKKLILKLHPVEFNARLKPRVNPLVVIEKLLGKTERDLKNVIIVRPNDNISSYKLFPHLDGGILYTGTLGLELIYKGIPVINGTIDAPYTDYGFTIDARTQREYFDFFDTPEKALLIQRKNYHKFINFLFIYMHVNSMPVSYFDDDTVNPLEDRSLKQIVDVILDKNNGSYYRNIYKKAIENLQE